MHHLTATVCIWFVMIGLTLGWVVETIFEDKGMNLTWHLISALVGSFFGGLVFTYLGLDGRLVFAAFCSVIFSVLLDVYYVALKKEHEPKHEDVTIVHH